MAVTPGLETFRPPEVPDLDEARRAMKYDLYNNLLHPGEKADVAKMTPEDFINKHHDVLVSDFESFNYCLDFFASMGIEKFRKLAEFGYVYLVSKNPETVRNYVANVPFSLSLDFNDSSLRDLKFYTDNPQLVESAREERDNFLTYFIKEKASKALDSDGYALAYVLNLMAEVGREDLFAFLEAKVKSFDLSDEALTDIINYIGFDSKEIKAKIRPALVKLVMQSKEKPFENEANFMQALMGALFVYKKIQNRDIVALVLRRGEAFIANDTRITVEKQLAAHNLKLEDLLK